MSTLPYLEHYSPTTKEQVKRLIAAKSLGKYILEKYPTKHNFATDRALYDYVLEYKNAHLKKSPPLSKVLYDSKVQILNALGTHRFISRVQGGKLKAKNEIHIAPLFKQVPEPFLRMIVIHELAHFKEKEHNKAFYKLCEYMDKDYHQLEFDLRLYLTHIDLEGKLY